MSAPLDSLPGSEKNAPHRDRLRAQHLAPEDAVLREALNIVRLDEAARVRVRAGELAAEARRRASQEGFALSLVHRFGLDTQQGIALMQLAEALPRASAPETRHALIADKTAFLSWRDAVGRTSSFAERMALHALDTLTHTFRDPRASSALQRAAARSVQWAIGVLNRQYVLGETLASAYRRGRRLARLGYRFSYDMLGEAAMTDDAARQFQRSYLEAIEFLSGRSHDRYAISVKLSALHPRFEERQRTRLDVLIDRVQAIALRARQADLQLTIDAEESDRLELTLDVFEALLAHPELRGWSGLGLAVQAYQRRALAVIDYLGEATRAHAARINVRLVKGAYWDSEIKRAQQLGLDDYPIFLRKSATDAHFLACAQRLLERRERFYPQFATHNAHTLAAVCELARQTGNDQFELQRLHGMGEHLHTALLREGYQSRIYAPIGPRQDLLPYLVRRLLENGASSSFVRQLTDASIPIDQLTRDPLEHARAQLGKAPAVPPPRAIREQSWPAARGFDWAQRPTATQLLAAVEHSRAHAHSAAPLIRGERASGPSRVIRNPARREDVVGTVIDANEAHVHQAIESAYGARRAWNDTPHAIRADILRRAAELLEQRALQFIALAVREAGKTLDDAVSEIREAADFCRYYATQSLLPDMAQRDAHGVVACISPWNFPLAIFMGQIAGALAAGNTVVAKPAEQTPLIAMLATQLLHDAGIPSDVLHLLPGDGQIGAALTSDARVAAIVFTGSTDTARAIARSLAPTHRSAIPFIAETGGINAMIVDCTALPEQAVRDVLISAFQSAGQRCSALRILCVQDEAYDRVIALLRGALQELRIGDPSRLDTDVGPLIDADAQRMVQEYLQNKSVLARAPMDDALLERGTFVAPALIEVSRVADVTREVFGPVLHIVRYAAAELPLLMQEINALGFGLTLGIHTRIKRRAQILADDARIGNVYVNRHQVGAVVGQQPFGGSGLSGTGPKAGGPHYLLRLSRQRAPLRSVPTSQLQIVTRPLDTRVRAALGEVRAAQALWSRMQRRAERIQFACELIGANASHALGDTARTVCLPEPIDLQAALPSIAGEDNTLRLRPRGVLLCLDCAQHSLDTLAAQIFMTTATGNGALVPALKSLATPLRELIAELQQMGMQSNLVIAVELNGKEISSEWLVELEIDGVVCDGADADRDYVASLLNARPGPLLPVLSRQDDIRRFGIEQTLTINTAAAGGDPKLLAMSS